MGTVEFANVYPYQRELVVEIGVRDGTGELTVHSFHYEYCGDDRVQPRSDVEDRFRDEVEYRLDEAGYATV
jgi:hypothetical protein